jgi:hypothetical protein
MNFLPRSAWTSIVPRPTTVGDNHSGLEFFTEKPKDVEFYTPDRDIMYAYRNPTQELVKLLEENTNGTGISDLNCNYAIAPNVEGVYVVRGALSKCAFSNNYRVLVLNGIYEKPTDLLKKNQQLAIDLIQGGGQNVAPKPVLKPGDINVHVFDLIEWMTQQGFYFARNDATYGPLLQHGMRMYQNSRGVTELNGVYDEWTYLSVPSEREYIQVLAPVG